MYYKILAVHAKFDGEKLKEVAVLWESSPGYNRATIAKNKPISGYKFLLPKDRLTEPLIQDIAGAGMYLRGEELEKYFPTEKEGVGR